MLGLECAELFAADYRVTLDLAKVSSVDSMGLQVLNALWKLGATLIECSGRDAPARFDAQSVTTISAFNRKPEILDNRRE